MEDEEEFDIRAEGAVGVDPCGETRVAREVEAGGLSPGGEDGGEGPVKGCSGGRLCRRRLRRT